MERVMRRLRMHGWTMKAIGLVFDCNEQSVLYYLKIYRKVVRKPSA